LELYGTISNVTISSINIAKSFILSFNTATSYGGSDTSNIMAEITSATNIRFSREDNYQSVKITWQVIEFL